MNFLYASQKNTKNVPKSTYFINRIAVHSKITAISSPKFMYTYYALILTVKRKKKYLVFKNHMDNPFGNFTLITKPYTNVFKKQSP